MLKDTLLLVYDCVEAGITILTVVVLHNVFSSASPLTSATIDPSDYTISKQLHSKLMLYAKIDGVSNFGYNDYE